MTLEMPTEARVREVLRDVIDPEIGLNVEDLGLVYGVSIEPMHITVTMTMTTPACPLGSVITDDARERIRAIAPPSVEVDVELVWDPPWSPARMSETAKSFLGWG